MKKIRRTAVILFAFGMGILTSNQPSPRIIIGYSLSVLLWAMLWDFGNEERRVDKDAKNIE